MNKIISALLAFLLIGGGVYSQDKTTVTKDKKEVPQEQKDKYLPETQKNEVKTEIPKVDSVKNNNIDTTKK